MPNHTNAWSHQTAAIYGHTLENAQLKTKRRGQKMIHPINSQLERVLGGRIQISIFSFSQVLARAGLSTQNAKMFVSCAECQNQDGTQKGSCSFSGNCFWNKKSTILTQKVCNKLETEADVDTAAYCLAKNCFHPKRNENKQQHGGSHLTLKSRVQGVSVSVGDPCLW